MTPSCVFLFCCVLPCVSVFARSHQDTIYEPLQEHYKRKQKGQFISTEEGEGEIDDNSESNSILKLDVPTQLQLIWKSIAELKHDVEDIKEEFKDVDQEVDHLAFIHRPIERSVHRGQIVTRLKNNVTKVLQCEGFSSSRRGVKLHCDDGQHIKILSANYGRTEPYSELCFKALRPEDTECRATKSKSIMRKRCNGKTTCIVDAANYVFGDPCYGTYKYLEVQYKCIRPTQEANKRVPFKQITIHDPPMSDSLLKVSDDM